MFVVLAVDFEVQVHAFGPLHLVLLFYDQFKVTREHRVLRVALHGLAVINDDPGQVSQSRPDKLLEHRLVLRLHARTRVDLYQPYAQLLIHHEIISKELEAVLAVVYNVLHSLRGRLHLVLDLLVDDLLEDVFDVGLLVLQLFVQVVRKFVAAPDVTENFLFGFILVLLVALTI